MLSLLVLISSAAASVVVSPLASNPSTVLPEAPPVARVVCGAPAPASGTVFAGPVLHVFNGRTLCVAQGPDPSEWIRVTLPEGAHAATRSDLMAATFARRVVCQADHPDGRGVVAHCVLDDVPLDQLVDSPAVRAEAASWR